MEPPICRFYNCYQFMFGRKRLNQPKLDPKLVPLPTYLTNEVALFVFDQTEVRLSEWEGVFP